MKDIVEEIIKAYIIEAFGPLNNAWMDLLMSLEGDEMRKSFKHDAGLNPDKCLSPKDYGALRRKRLNQIDSFRTQLYCALGIDDEEFLEITSSCHSELPGI